MLTLAACSGDDAGGDGKSDDACASCSLKQAAARAGVRVGVAAKPKDAAWNDLIVREFDALSPEGELVWDVIHPEPAMWIDEPAVEVLDFAEEHGLFTTVSHFVWDQATEVSGTPTWVHDIDDPAALRDAMRSHLTTVMERHGARIDRWIVVNEPLVYTGPGELYQNHFYSVLGPDYIAETFQIAEELAPSSELWLNEIFTEDNAPKSARLVELAADLVDRGIPIDGVGIQGHFLRGDPDFDLVEQTMRDLGALGLKTAFTEVDAPVPKDEPRRLEVQGERLSRVVRICLAVVECDSITFWGLHDGVSWLNWLMEPGLSPLLFDENLEPKPAYFAVRDALAAGRP